MNPDRPAPTFPAAAGCFSDSSPRAPAATTLQVVDAAAMGLCFGVRDALAAAQALPDPRTVTIHGELVHNETVLRGLRERGFAMTAENERAVTAATSRVMITAHGVSDHERARLLQGGKQLVDTTCPLVRRAHRTAQQLHAEGWHVLVIGRPGHVEVRGIVEDLDRYDVVAGVGDVRTWPHERLGIVCQTTTMMHDAAAIVAEVRARNPHAEVRFADTICEPTKQRIAAVEQLADDVDAVVVVGGKHSNNTRQLVELCRRRGVPAHHVQGAADLRPEWFAGCRSVGLTAGTSTPDSEIAAVREALRRLPVTDAPAALPPVR